MDRAARRAQSKLVTLDLNREDFGLFRDVLARVVGFYPSMCFIWWEE